MSSRVLKKLHGDNELDVCEQDVSDADLDIGAVGLSSNKKTFEVNRYDLFQQSLSESEFKEDDNETEHNSTAAPHRNEIKKKRKKRKKKTGAAGKHGQHKSSEDNADIDEITRSFKELDNLLSKHESAGAHRSAASHSSAVTTKLLLSVQHKNLNPAFEMKRMFGSKVVQMKNDRRNQRGGVRSLKSTWLVTPKESWPTVSKIGISMILDTAPQMVGGTDTPPSNVQWFKFEHNQNYRSLQQKFLAAVESMDSDNIVKIINQQPYHIDSLIQLSELCKMSEDHAMASELIEHAILALESALHPSFSLTTGNCRLDYRRQENRAFFVTLFKHAQYLEGRACSRTALEIGKLILSIEPTSDPLAMILIIDYYALRAKQYEWLIQLYDEWEQTNNLSQLPNMAYSYALALFHINKNASLDRADAAIQYAVLMFPGVVKRLLDSLSVQVDSRANSHKYIGAQAFDSQSPALQQLTSLYVCRSKTIWRDSDILPWLERNVNIVLDRVDAKEPIVQDYATKRSQRYKNPPRAILRHIILSDFKEKVPLSPFINRETEPIVMYDPLPPLDSINIYKRPTMSSNSRLLPDASPLSMFFQSLLPNFNVQEAVLDERDVLREAERRELALNNLLADDDGAGAAEAMGAPLEELRNSLNSVVDAMRDFLTNMRVPELPNDADVDENESSDDGANDDYLT